MGLIVEQFICSFKGSETEFVSGPLSLLWLWNCGSGGQNWIENIWQIIIPLAFHCGVMTSFWNLQCDSKNIFYSSSDYQFISLTFTCPCAAATHKPLAASTQHLFIILFSSTPSSSHYVVTLHHSHCSTSFQTCWQHYNPIISVGNMTAPALTSPKHDRAGAATIGRLVDESMSWVTDFIDKYSDIWLSVLRNCFGTVRWQHCCLMFSAMNIKLQLVSLA